MIITLISDTHNRHNQLKLPGGDILIHAGDFTSRGYMHEIDNFCKWFSKQDNYENKIFIAGNHDFGFQDSPNKAMEIVSKYPNIIYLQDDFVYVGEHPNFIKIYGSPWQPEFYNWAFNLPRNGWEIEQKWNDIPADIDILITHGPSFGYLDKVIGRKDNLGCELLNNRIKAINPKIHVCGHIHSAYGYIKDENTHYFNASVLNEGYVYTQPPITIEWDYEKNEIEIK